MNMVEIKAAVDAGQVVHWANEAYRVHKDHLGQYLITYLPNGSTIGLTNRQGTRLNGAEQDFFVPGSGTAPQPENRDGPNIERSRDVPDDEAS